MDNKQQTGLFWTPRGGNNAADIWASCHTFSSVTRDKQTGETQTTTVIVDMGQHEIPKSFSDASFDKVVPALDDCLPVPNMGAPEHPAQAIFLTHCHSDHTVGVYEYLMMGAKLPPIYASEYTINSLKKGLLENRILPESWPELKPVEAGDVVEVGNMSVEVFPASHSVPGCFGFKLSNEEASIFHSGDTKADETSFLGKGVDLAMLKRVGENGGVDLMTFDATATHMDGHATYESDIFDSYKELFEQNGGRQIVAALPAAHMERLASVISAAAAAGKDVVIDGGAAMESNLMALKLAGYDLQKKCPNIRIVGATEDKSALPPVDKSVVITTGIYAEPASPLVQLLKGENDRFDLRNNAVLIVPTSKDNNEKLLGLVAQSKFNGVKVITGEDKPIYGSGHAQSDDFKMIAQNVCPKAVSPMHCSAVKAATFNALAAENGYQTLPVYPHNGSTVQVNKDGCKVVEQNAPNWFGLRHKPLADGRTGTAYVKVGDNGYSMPKAQKSLHDRQATAAQKIADYHQKQSKQTAASLLVRRIHERNNRVG